MNEVRVLSDLEYWWLHTLREAIRADEPDDYMELLTAMRGSLADRTTFVLIVAQAIYESVKQGAKSRSN